MMDLCLWMMTSEKLTRFNMEANEVYKKSNPIYMNESMEKLSKSELLQIFLNKVRMLRN